MTMVANEIWAMNVMNDTLADGRTLRALTVADTHTRECVVLEAARTPTGAGSGGILEKAGGEPGRPPHRLSVDSGMELTSSAPNAWPKSNPVQLVLLGPGEAVDNPLRGIAQRHGEARVPLAALVSNS